MMDIEKFVEVFQQYKKEQETHKRRGLSGFNIFTTLLDKQQLYITLKEANAEYQLLRKSLMDEFFDKVIVELEKGLGDDRWVVIEMETPRSGERYYPPLRIEQKNTKDPMGLFGFEFTQNNFSSPGWVIILKDEPVKRIVFSENFEIKKPLSSTQNTLASQNDGQLKYEDLYKGNFCEEVIGYENIDMAAKDFSNRFLIGFNDLAEVIYKSNEIIHKERNSSK